MPNVAVDTCVIVGTDVKFPVQHTHHLILLCSVSQEGVYSGYLLLKKLTESANFAKKPSGLLVY